MLIFIIRRLLQTIVVLIVVSFFAFLLMQLIPGDPVVTMLGQEASQAQIDALRNELGLDRPLMIQYLNWLANVIRGDFGKSIIFGENVTDLILSRLPITFHLGLIALILSICISIPAGVLSAVRRGGLLDSIITVSANLGMAIPLFWLGILGIYFFSLKLGWLPVQGYTSPFSDFWMNTKQIIMPCICMAVVPLASLARQTRSSMLEVIRRDYIRTARSKGLKQKTIITDHALKNAIIPIITLIGIQLRNLVGGSVLVETVFNIPGIGRLMVRAVFDKDFLIVQGCIVMIALVVALANLLVDISYGYFDPRIRYED
jgi:peptide/nickel transport system permease protein